MLPEEHGDSDLDDEGTGDSPTPNEIDFDWVFKEKSHFLAFVKMLPIFYQNDQKFNSKRFFHSKFGFMNPCKKMRLWLPK